MQARWWVVALAACGSAGGGGPAVDAPAGDAITAPAETWTWIPIDGVTCGNGAPSGIGVNLTDRSKRVMIYLQGGGACWDAATCFAIKSAVNIESGYTEAMFGSEIAQASSVWVYQRDNAQNPFRDASWIYVPYCTGDLHDGTRTATYDVFGTPRTVAHVGALNYEAILARVQATRPDADLVWLVGVSAGAYGVGFNVEKTRAAWPSRPVHVLADSSPLITTEPTRWQTMQMEWAMRFPAGCTGCTSDMGAIPAALQSGMPSGTRYGLLSYTRDQVISTYFGVSADQFQTELTAEVAAMGAGQAAFLLTGTNHTMITSPTLMTSNSVTLLTWVNQWASGDPAWVTVGP